MLATSSTAAASIAIKEKFSPASMPTAAVHQMVAAVFSPRMEGPSCQITPTHMNPTPETTCAAILVGLESWVTNSATRTYAAEPMHTRALVWRPAGCLRICRSKPMAVPSNRAKIKPASACMMTGVTLRLSSIYSGCGREYADGNKDHSRLLRGRDPERLKLKLTGIRADPFAFFRGTCPLLYSSLRLDRTLVSSPSVLACGDLHPENFASHKGDNRLVYFDLSDFDESCVSPVAFKLVRFLTSILVAAKPLKISDEIASKMVVNFIETYAANLNAAKPRWVERSIATGPARKLLRGVKGRHRAALIRRRTHRKSGKIRLVIDGKNTLAASSQDRARAASILTAYASTRPSPAFFEPMDIARRIAGTGSLGLGRYVALGAR